MLQNPGSVAGKFTLLLAAWSLALAPTVLSGTSVSGGAVGGGLRLIEVRAERLIIPPVAVELSDSLPDVALPVDGGFGIGVVVEFMLDGRARVLDAAAGAINWYRRDGREWSAIGRARLSPEIETALKQAAIEGAGDSVFVIPEGQDVEPFGLYRGFAELRWVVPETGPLSVGIGAVVRGRPWDPAILRGDTRTPELVEKVDPIYPEDARQAGIQGRVVLQVAIDAGGSVTDVRVLRPATEAYPSLDAAAMEAVRTWRYRPAMKQGELVSSDLLVVVEFSSPE
jgi:TonB family protein